MSSTTREESGVDGFSCDVVIPTHGRDDSRLFEAIESVELQTCPASRIVVVVDGNPETATVVRRRYPTVSVICLARPQGAAAARQAGILACQAEWVAFLDDDDLWSRDKQERTARYVREHPRCDAVRAGYWMFADVDEALTGLNGQVVEIRAGSLPELERKSLNARPMNDLGYLDIEGDSLSLMLEFNRGVTSTTVVRRDILTSLPPVPVGQRPGDDHLLFCHVAAMTEWHLIKARLAYYRVHPAQDTRKVDPTAGRGIVVAKVRAWEAHGHENSRQLADYGPTYRAEVRQLMWPLVKAGSIRAALDIWVAARPLLPRRRDRICALVPDPVVWHLQSRMRSRRGQRTLARPPEW